MTTDAAVLAACYSLIIAATLFSVWANSFVPLLFTFAVVLSVLMSSAYGGG